MVVSNFPINFFIFYSIIQFYVIYSFNYNKIMDYLEILFKLIHAQYSYFLLYLCKLLFQMIHFVRHAQSIWNLVEHQIQLDVGKEYFDSEPYTSGKFDRKYADVEITEKGVAQAYLAKEKLKDIDVDLIIVSPMRRALHTCSIVFQDHHSKAQVVVDPALREIMESSCDVGTEIAQSIARYPTFDFSLIKDPNSWYIETLHQDDRERINKKLEGLEGSARKEVAIEETTKLQKQNWIERRAHPQRQLELKQRILPSYSLAKKAIEGYLEKYKRVAIVAHSQCIKQFIGIKIENCQIFSLPASQL